MSRWVDGVTQRWVIWTGRRVDLVDVAWLQGPVGDRGVIGDAWLAGEAARLGAAVSQSPHAGLLTSVASLNGPGFVAEHLHPLIRAFYEHIADWRLEVSVQWSWWAWPFGWLVAAGFARRLQQLALPLHRGDVAAGMTSTVTRLCTVDGQVAALWLRRLAATGSVVFSGLYDTVQLPATSRPRIRVSFPLPNGRLVVLLAADITTTGALVLSSTAGGWGDPGAYLVVQNRHGTWARRIPVREAFHVYVDEASELRTDHQLTLWRLPVARLRYRITGIDA